MTPDQYVAAVLEKYKVPTGPYSITETTANSLLPTLRSWAGYYLSNISYSGSYAKGTGVRGTTDIDLFISLQSAYPSTLKEMYDSLHNYALWQNWSPRRQNVSIGISVNNVDVDLVPARIQPGYQNYHSLYRNKVDSWTQTNVSLHINTVSSSNRTNEIRAIKIWRKIHGLDFPSFYLELVVIEALKGRSYYNLSANVMHALQYIADYLPNSRFIDPANTANIVSEDITQQEKQRIATQARASSQQPYWEQIIW